ncbi:MAG: hypothetical protein CVU42_17420 [Chloroflexi bacterium HGW-Chloroflexi-4]|nr:MAG: hypothetical protein CVU42_17420 [Chloroflexi bacterium HGW-Chloroflexi-4]
MDPHTLNRLMIMGREYIWPLIIIIVLGVVVGLFAIFLDPTNSQKTIKVAGKQQFALLIVLVGMCVPGFIIGRKIGENLFRNLFDTNRISTATGQIVNEGVFWSIITGLALGIGGMFLSVFIGRGVKALYFRLKKK